MPHSDTSTVSLAMPQLDQAAEVLVRAFQNDPMMRYVISDSTRMLDAPLSFYRANIRMGLLFGEVHTLPAVRGVAVWLSPGNTDPTFSQVVRSGMLRAILSMGPMALFGLMRPIPYQLRVNKQVISEPHWFLSFLAIDPPHQGKGLGGVLIQPILRKADATGVPCYLDSTNERNLSFYERHGFELAAHGRAAKGVPEAWAMLRKPSQAKT